MKLLRLCVATAIVAAMTAGSHIVRAQALGEAATLSTGLSSAGSASASALGNSIGRAMRSDGRRIASSARTSKSGGAVNLHWTRDQLGRSATKTPTQANGKVNVRSDKAKPDFVIVGADPQNSDADSGDASASKPTAVHPSASQPKPSRDKGSSGEGGKN